MDISNNILIGGREDSYEIRNYKDGIYRKKIKDQEIRVELDHRSESVGRKNRDAELSKIPSMLIVGDKEIEAGKVAVRRYGEGDRGQLELKDIIKEINN